MAPCDRLGPGDRVGPGRLAGCLVELREAVDVAAGEWWQRALPEERIARAEQQGHRALAGLVRQLPAAVPTPVPVA